MQVHTVVTNLHKLHILDRIRRALDAGTHTTRALGSVLGPRPVRFSRDLALVVSCDFDIILQVLETRIPVARIPTDVKFCLVM